MVDVRSKNLYELLGNDPELDPNRPPEPPTRAVDRPVPRHGKRDAPKEPINEPRLSEANARRGGRMTGNEAAFRDRNAGARSNREKPTDETTQPPRRGERGGRFRTDRQSRTGQTDTRKQVQQGWGSGSGEKTWDDERVGENLAKEEEQGEPATPAPPVPADEAPQEAEDKSKSYSDYLAEQAQKDNLAAKPVRTANEGSKLDKKWQGAKELKRDEDADAYMKGTQDKAKREKHRKEKTLLDVDLRFVEQPRPGGPSNSPRGGGRGRGGDRGGRGGDRGGDRGGRGGAAGFPRGRGGRGAGPRGPAGPSVTVDETNFPSLGAK